MGDEWREVKLSEVCEIRRGSSPRPIVDYISKTKGFPWVKIADATSSNSKFIEKTNQFIREEGASRSVIVSKGDLILANSGTAGLPKFMSITACIHDGWQVLRNLNGITKEFLYYTLLYIRPVLLHNAYDSTMKNLTLDMVRAAQIKLPPLREQKQITCTLVSIDRKIELNRQTNETLEKMAQALFKSWFVDFDPVIDNALAAGNTIPDELQDRAARRQQQLAKPDHQPLPDAIRQLFPSEFELTEALGWVPMGWEVCSLGEKVTVKRGGSPRPIKGFIVPDGLPWTKISDASTSKTRFIKKTKKFIKPEGLSKTTLLKKGTLILSNSATPGLPKFLDLDACIHDGWLHFPKVDTFNDHYLYQLFLVIRQELIQQGNGSVFTNLKTDILRDHTVVVASKAVMANYGRIVGDIHKKLLALADSTDTLEKLRDTLLPKLISGELRLPPDASADAEQQLADATS